MSREKRWIERIKSLFILLLTVSAVFLAWKTGLFQRLMPEHEYAAPAEPTPGVSSYQVAAEPICAAVTGVPGLICGVCYDDKAIHEVMQEFRSVLGETLGSASLPVQVEESVWRDALLGPGLFLDYGTPVSLNVLARWMGTTAGFAPEQRAYRLLFALPEEDKVDFYYLDEQGRAFFCETLALGSTLYAGMNGFLPNGAEFAMQVDTLQDCDPYALILRDLPRLPAVTASDECSSAAIQTAADLFGIRLNAGSSFQEQEDTVYLADEGRLRLEADGAIRYLSADGKDFGGAESEEDRIELSRSLLARFADVCGGAGDLQYAASLAEENHVTYRFDYRVSGIRVKLTGGSAGWAVFRDGRLIELGFRPRTYQITEEMVYRIPPLQAAAASGSIQRGSAPELIISDPGGDVLLEPVWIMQEGRT